MHDKEQKVKVVCCSGEGDASNYVEHPKIYLTVGVGQEITCPYCSRIFTFISHD
ncbi:zinc-finger domain-containing protein [Ehrlichia japonica]|uniref:Zinc-finger domain protein n=1 Tax=Ehrlichia japonica TaxID=391036 RepID=X5H1U5_9RICK|nr:zinc-finger domain-containing protein [Ehrlichia japonica]AHX04819.1 zinc-finger domain protein [Ehrlichia japonica]